MGFYSLLDFVLELDDDTVHSSQWTVEWTDSWIFVADLHQPLPDQ